jgi:hypothetical protein
MRQTLHIFRKDVRRLWAPLSIALAIQALFVFFETRPERGLPAEELIDFLMPVAWWYLIVALVHGEALPGDRQFWISRPYRWKSLLAAKVLFIVAFVNLPVAIADSVILPAQGFSVAGHWQGMLWRQVPFTIMLLVPPLALGSLTRNLGQVIVAVLLIVLRIVVGSIPFSSLPSGYTAVSWTEGVVSTFSLLAVLSAVIVIQYRARRTWLARALFAGFVLVPALSLPVRWQLAWQARARPPAIDTTAIRIAFDSTRGQRSPLVRTRGIKYIVVAFPVRVSGAPDGVSLVSSQTEVTIGKDTFVEGATLDRDRRGYWMTVELPLAVSPSRPVTLRIRPVVTAVRQTEFRVPLETDFQAEIDIGPVRLDDYALMTPYRR